MMPRKVKVRVYNSIPPGALLTGGLGKAKTDRQTAYILSEKLRSKVIKRNLVRREGEEKAGTEGTAS